ncbi:tyrosine-type recombinase/integrase [Bacillus sp. FSL P2-0092]|uniref:tyrosine-type recombinase/integrase n=1 Tax=Bacillus sp. FSL P2-0092 TaxID=2921571 RepID=UPI0030F61270
MSANRSGKRVKKERTLRKTSSNLDVLFIQFRAIKKSEGRAEGTIEQYENNYGFFIEYLDRHKIARSINEINRDVIRRYIVYMKDEWVKFEDHAFKKERYMTKGLAPSTINTRLKTLRVFFKTIHDEGLIETNPMYGIKNVSEPEEEIIILDEEELRILFAAPNQRDYADFRDYVLMNVLLDGMMRISEALGLRTENFDFKGCSLYIPAPIAKNRKARTVPIEFGTAKLLNELITENKADFDSDYLFLANYGEPLTRDHFRKRLVEYAKEVGIKKRVHPHLFRHTSATMYLEAGGDIRHLQMLLGHSDLRMVMRYTHLSGRSLTEQHDKYSAINAVRKKLNKQRKLKRR